MKRLGITSRILALSVLLTGSGISPVFAQEPGQLPSDELAVEQQAACLAFLEIAGITCTELLVQLAVPPEDLADAVVLFETNTLIEEAGTDPGDESYSYGVEAGPGSAGVFGKPIPVIPDGCDIRFPDRCLPPITGQPAPPPEDESQAGGLTIGPNYVDVDAGRTLGIPKTQPAGVPGAQPYNLDMLRDQDCYVPGKRGGITAGAGELNGTAQYYQPKKGQATPSPTYKYRAWGHQEGAKGSAVPAGLPDYGVLVLFHAIRAFDTGGPHPLRQWEPKQFSDVNGSTSFGLGVSVPPISLEGSWTPADGRAGGGTDDQQSHYVAWGGGPKKGQEIGAGGHSIWRIAKGQLGSAEFRWGCFAAFVT